MDTNKATSLFLACLLPAVCFCGSLPVYTPKEVTVDYGFSFGGDVYLVSGTEGIVMSNQVEIRFHVTTGNPYFLPGMTAAFASSTMNRILYFGGGEAKRVSFKTRESADFTEDGVEAFMANGDPDAVAHRDDQRYFFRGCEITRLRTNEMENAADYGLPCNVDAAWYEADNERMVILRGDQIWLWGDDDSVSGPVPFSSVYRITSWTLKPYVEMHTN